jgi:hypothetical protein
MMDERVAPTPEPATTRPPPPLALGQPAHVGHIVADLDAAMDSYGVAFDVTWATPVSYGRSPRASRFTCSRQGPVLVELIEEVPGTIWSVEHGSPIHHLAYWVDDLEGVAGSFEALGFSVEAAGPTFVYLRSPLGLRIELMDSVVRPSWDAWLQGGVLTVPARSRSGKR